MKPDLLSLHGGAPGAAQPTAQVISLESLAPLADDPAHAAHPPLVRQAHPLHAVRISLQARVGEAGMSIGELMGARQGQVLALDSRVDDPVDLLLDGQVVARGQLVALDGSFAVRVTELPMPLVP